MTGNLIQNYLNTHPRLEKAENTSVKNSNGKKSYLTYNNKIDTFNKTKPEAAQGHLINDTAADKLKYFVYDRKYDLKALKKGFNGTAKDHQLGRLNDVGLIIGGTAIATFIATGKQSPKLKIMEFLGFGAFLASMKLWPKLAIEIPAKLKHGFNVNKQYIDDQGRKKSVFQDPQYIPWDLYDQNKDDENFSKIGDKMGISKTIPNRDEVVKEQMRKVAVQNNTLWMLSSGFATPVMTALIASGCEGPLGNLLENIENSKTNKKITKILENLNNGSEISFDKTRFDKLNKILESNTGKVVDKNFVESVASTLSEGLDATTMDAIKKDLTSVLTPKNPTVTASSIEDVINSIKTTLTETMSKDKIETHFPKLDTIKEAIKEYFPNAIDGTHTLTNPSQADDFAAIIKDVINDSFVTKVSNKELDSIKNVVENTVTNSLKTTSSVLNNEQSKIISEFAKEILKFESTHEALEKCATLKVGRVENSLLARNWGEVEKTLIDVLGINSNELQAIKNSRISTEQLFAQKLEILAKPENEQAYKQALEKLTKTMEKFDLKLEGNAGTSSKMQELFDAFSTNYERTSSGISRITSSGKKVFENSNTVQRLLEERFAGAGSHKNMVIGDKLNRIDEVRFSYQRILKAFDIFKRAGEIDPSNKYELELAKKAKEII